MIFKRFQFRVATLLVCVAVLSVVLGGGRWFYLNDRPGFWLLIGVAAVSPVFLLLGYLVGLIVTKVFRFPNDGSLWSPSGEPRDDV